MTITPKAIDAALENNECPDCGGFIFRPGPCGGISQNVECVGCEHRFNVTWWRGVFITAVRIRTTAPWREDMFPRVLQ